MIAATPAPADRAAPPSRKASITARIAPPRATTSHRSGAALPKIEKTVVKRTGSGFHDGPPVVCRSRWAISRPQMIQAHGSYVGVEGYSSENAPSASAAAASSA